MKSRRGATQLKQLGDTIKVGSTSYYGIRFKSAEAVLAVVKGHVKQVGIADRRVAGKSKLLLKLLHSFKSSSI